MKRPDLSKEKIISIDIETYDPELVEMRSPGVYRKDGYVLGFSIATEDLSFSEYYNLAHPGITEEEKTANLQYLQEILLTKSDKLGANILYDLDWLVNGLGLNYRGKFHDVQYAEPLLNEYAKTYALDELAKKYIGIGKSKGAIEAFCERNGLKGSPQSHLYLMSYETVREYALQDAKMPIQIFECQRKLLQEQNLEAIYDLERRQIPLLLQMRKSGVRISRERVEKAAMILMEERDKIREELWKQYGYFNYNSSKQLAELFDKLNIEYGHTEKGNPSITNDDLESSEHPILNKIKRVREVEKTLNTFIAGAFTKFDINGRIHGMFHPLRQDEGGTVSGRYSSSGPNLQQIPGKEDTNGTLCRSCFIPEENCFWGKIDYSQIEYRVIANYAIGPKSEDIREQYRNNPKTDYHQLVMDWTGVDRPTSKRLNFGMAYFMGVSSMAKKFGWTIEHAQYLQDLYFETVPFMKPTRTNVVSIAKGRGFIKTLLGRRARVSEEMRKNRKEYVMFNRLIQGTAADIFKKQAVDAYEAGIFNVITPHIFVHDENGVSVPKTKEGIQAYMELKYIMENCVTLKVPIIADAELGDSWGETSEEKYEQAVKEYLQ